MIRTQPAPTTLEIESRAVITDSGLSLPEGLSYDEWLGVGRKLMLADKAVQWAIGDWWAYGDHRYGERASAAIDPASGENRLQRYANYAWVARSIETSRRREVLSWSCHEAVAALEPEVQDAILKRAVENGWASREVRAAVKEYKDRLASGNKPKLSAQTPVEDAEIIEDEDDKPVFDTTAAGADMDAELRAENRREFKEARAERSFSTATEKLTYALSLVKAMRNDPEFRSALDASSISASDCELEGHWLVNLAREVRHRQNIEFDNPRKPRPAHAEATADGEADGKRMPRTASPINSNPANVQTVDGLVIEQPDDIPANLRREHG